MVKTSIITINYCSQPLIHKMEKLFYGTDEIQLIVVDNSGEFTANCTGTIVIKPGSNIGFGRGCNLGAKHAKSEFLVFLNPDALIDKATLQALIAAAPVKKQYAIWGPAIHDGKGLVPTLKAPGRLGLIFRRDYIDISVKPRSTIPVLYVSGACMAIGEDLFSKIGGFCEDIFLYAEDLDLCLRASEVEAKIYICADLYIDHAGGRSSSEIGARFKRLGRSINGHYVFLRRRRLSKLRAIVNAIHLASGLRV